MLTRYRDESSHPQYNAQRNLMGRTHYVDPESLRYHYARVLSARPHCGGLIFALIESCALDMHNRSRGFRYVVFDIFGTVISRVDLEDCYKSRAAASKGFWQWLETFDAKAHTLEAIDKAERYSIEEYARMRADVLGAQS